MANLTTKSRSFPVWTVFLGALACMLWSCASETVREVSSVESSDTFLEAVPHIVAIGDVHGDLVATRRALQLAGAIDETDQWVGGDLVVVQTGDQLDRGDDEQEILDLLARLVPQAEAAGGALHVLNGNHELMNAEIDLRYVTEGGFRDFEDVPGLNIDDPDSLLLAHDESQRARVAAFRPGGPYAKLLAERNVVLQVGETVFVHGGVLPHHVDYGLEKLNQEVRTWLAGEGARPDSILKRDSPVWTRAYSNEPDEADCDLLIETLASLSAKRMVVGHTIQDGGIRSYCGGHVWCIDVGMASHYGGRAQVLSIRGDEVTVLRSTPLLDE